MIHIITNDELYCRLGIADIYAIDDAGEYAPRKTNRVKSSVGDLIIFGILFNAERVIYWSEDSIKYRDAYDTMRNEEINEPPQRIVDAVLRRQEASHVNFCAACFISIMQPSHGAYSHIYCKACAPKYSPY